MNAKRVVPGEIHNRQRERLEFSYHAGAPECPRLVVLGHGVTGNKDRPVLVEVGNALAGVGVHVLRFSFAGNGGSEGRFEEATLTKEVEDLEAVLDGLPGWEIGYAGHSMGAAVGVLRASEDSRIRFLISIAGMAHVADFTQREFGYQKPGEGFMWDKPECPLSAAWVEDMVRVGSVVEAARKVKRPWLFVHGLADDVVPPRDSRDLMEAAGGIKRLFELPDADHVFSGDDVRTAAEEVAGWVRRLEL